MDCTAQTMGEAAEKIKGGAQEVHSPGEKTGTGAAVAQAPSPVKVARAPRPPHRHRARVLWWLTVIAADRRGRRSGAPEAGALPGCYPIVTGK